MALIFLHDANRHAASRHSQHPNFPFHPTSCAAELATIFPAACERYKKFCNAAKATPTARWPPRTLAGRCLIIPPQKADTGAGAPRIYVVCLFTSYGFGRPNPLTGKQGKDGPPKILAQTREALGSFREQLGEMAELESKERMVIYSPMFNSGAFGVAWERTEALIEDTFKGWKGSWIVLAPPESS